MKEFIICALEILEYIKIIDKILGIGLIIIIILIILNSDARRSLVSVFSAAFNLFRTIILNNQYIGAVFFIILLGSGIMVCLFTKSIVTAILFLVMPFKVMYKEIDNAKKDNEPPIIIAFLKMFWKFYKSFLGYSITYYLLILKLPTEFKKIIIYGYQTFINRLLNGEWNVIIILMLLSLSISLLISIFITDAKRFSIIEQDIIAINRKSKYNKLSKAQIERVIVETKYFEKVRIKAEVLKVIANLNKYEPNDLKKFLKSSMLIYSFLKVKESNKKQFLNFLDKLLYCCDEYNIYREVVNIIKSSSRDDVIRLMNNIDKLWSNICCKEKQVCLEFILKEIEKNKKHAPVIF
ncbi:hypothetical protein FC774_09305 [Clostridium botulinum]|uniref:Uncharacterized protein n=1 Tax=Clostridium botulinum TaxID=1491 RepID=A0A6M0V5R1_CLOBO|nr:hypothetical protein [Clostridium botulinum]